MAYDFSPFNREGEKTKTVLIEDNKCVVRMVGFGPLIPPYLCGYVALPKASVPKAWWGNDFAIEDVNVHGGITYCEVEGDFVVFGFDCAHAGDENRVDMHYPNVIMDMVRDMERQLLAAAKVVLEV